MSDAPPLINAPWIGIAPLRLELVESYRQCLGIIARERKYLMFTDAPSPQQSLEFVQYVQEARFPLWMAFIPGPIVIGWCDICPQRFESRAHVGVLGVGVHPDFRGQGIGRLLMERAIKQAQTLGIERIELDVYSSNTRAISLYRSLGFQEEGIKRRARKIGNCYEDIVMMALFLRTYQNSNILKR